MYCCEFENTKDGSQNYKPQNILNHQLIFTRFINPYQRKNYRWLKYLTEAEHSQEGIIRDFINKFPEIKRIDWEEIQTSYGKWSAWVIKE